MAEAVPLVTVEQWEAVKTAVRKFLDAVAEVVKPWVTWLQQLAERLRAYVEYRDRRRMRAQCDRRRLGRAIRNNDPLSWIEYRVAT